MRTLVIEPKDQHNEVLLQNTHPPDWSNPEPLDRYNLVAIGGGTAGLVTAAGAAQLGGTSALVEKNLLGGDCLNTGCVPSKALIRASRIAMEVRKAKQFGIHIPEGTEVDFPAVMERVRTVRAKISNHDSVKRFSELGVHIFFGEARFLNREIVEVGETRLKFKKAVIATGARAVLPPIEGLEEVGALTNETVFNLTERPEKLAVIGGGPLGCELAQAFARLGSQVVVIHNKSHLLDREDEDAADLIQKRFAEEAITIVFEAEVKRVFKKGGRKIIHFASRGKEVHLEINEILVGTGRAPNVDGLNLEAAGVAYDTQNGVKVNDYLQTTNPRIYAAGDVCMNWKFTHAAEAAARIVLQNALFKGRKRVSSLVMPWCTYTDPEIAHVGLYEKEARQKGFKVSTFSQSLKEVDRAITDGEEGGFIKVHVKRGSDEVLGATIVAAHAGELITQITQAIVAEHGLKTLSSLIYPYPTLSELIKRVADKYNKTRLTPLLKGLVAGWLSWTR